MRTTRVYCAGVVLGATLAAALWMYTYDAWSVIEFIDRNGVRFHPSEHVRVQQWWSVPAAVAVTAIGVATSIWLLPEGPPFISRVLARFTTSRSRRSTTN